MSRYKVARDSDDITYGQWGVVSGDDREFRDDWGRRDAEMIAGRYSGIADAEASACAELVRAAGCQRLRYCGFLLVDGEPRYWPEKSFLSVAVPAPLEQLLERFGEALGMNAEEAAVFLLRNALVDSRRVMGEGWAPDRSRYMKETT